VAAGRLANEERAEPDPARGVTIDAHPWFAQVQKTDREPRRPLVIETRHIEPLDAERRRLIRATRIGDDQTRGARGSSDFELERLVVQRGEDPRVDVGDAAER